MKTFLLRLTIALLAAALTGCSLGSFAAPADPFFKEVSCVPAPAAPPVGLKFIYVVNLGWHTGVAVRSEDLSSAVRDLLPEARSSPWLELGWGDRGFYLASGYSYWQAFRAAFFSSGSVLHVAAFTESPELFFAGSQVFRAAIRPEGMAALSTGILESLKLDGTGNPTRLAASLYGKGSFYEATGSFWLFRTCNSWTSEMIAAVGCDIRPGILRASTLVNDMNKLPGAGEAPCAKEQVFTHSGHQAHLG